MATVMTSGRRGNTRNTRRQSEESEFDGIWLNLGKTSKDTGNFVRFNRGVALSDLIPKKLYEGMDDEFRSESVFMNKMLKALQTKAETLDEGESVSVKLEVVLYRRQEGLDNDGSEKLDRDVEADLFDDDDDEGDEV